MAWTLEYTRTARKAVEKLDLETRNRIRDYLRLRVAVLTNPRDLGKALKGPMSRYWAYRVGDHRIICDLQDQRLVILVVTVGNRRDVYN